MARYTEASCRLCRREAQKLFLKAEKCYTKKCPVDKRGLFPPGQHGQQRKKISEYGMQLREKQKARRFYGVLESQFAKYFDMAQQRKGVTGTNLLQILESRLDNVVYRIGMASSRAEARQLVRHAHFTVNGVKVNIPSYLVKPGDVITLRPKSRSKEQFKTILDITGSKVVPQWLEFDADKMIGKVVSLAAREDVDVQVSEHLIVEYYSK
ncbi:MAG: 30S ribosomal protein S4 [Clostridiales bacterium]|jgi:small subunit ribosomal protein S4|nr:30S ribosomal protein S4 [Clostridiales bacterium]